MTMSQATLAAELEALEPTDDEQTAIDRIASAWEMYFSDAELLLIAAPLASVTPGSLSGAVSAFRGGLVGMSTPNLTATQIQAAVVAFWGVVASASATIWIPNPATALNTGPAVPPAGITTIAASLSALFSSLQSSSATLADAVDQIASVIHSANTLTPATSPGSSPVTPTPVPVVFTIQ